MVEPFAEMEKTGGKRKEPLLYMLRFEKPIQYLTAAYALGVESRVPAGGGWRKWHESMSQQCTDAIKSHGTLWKSVWAGE